MEVGRRKTSTVVLGNRGVKVVVEKLDCFGVEGEERAGGQDDQGKMHHGINGKVQVVVEKLVNFLDDDGLRVASSVEKEMQS